MEIMYHSLCTREASEARIAENLDNERDVSLREWAIREKVHAWCHY